MNLINLKKDAKAFFLFENAGYENDRVRQKEKTAGRRD